jgi:UDP-N-acetylmuramoylalanine--D-glutamate ligase
MSGFRNDTFAGQRFAVVGLGRSGVAAAVGLRALGADVIAWDDRAAARAAAGDVVLRDPREAAYDALVLSPGIAHRLPAPHPIAADALARGLPILSDVELLYRAVRASGSGARFVGITGTNGKSTTTALLAHILEGAGMKVAAGANLGPAALGLPHLGDEGVYCLEMSSYMLERLATLRFDAAAMLNLSPDHLDRHSDMAGYARAKRAIFDRQSGADLAVVGIDDADSVAMADGLARVVRISGMRPADVWAEGPMLRDALGVLLDLRSAVALPGAHNAQNAAAAVALAQGLGVARAAIVAGVRRYPGLDHRQQLVAKIDGVAYVNDSKATNADAAARALACYARVVWIGGGIGKAGGIASLAPYFPRIAEALLIGRDAGEFAATLAAHGVAHRIVGTLEQAVSEAAAAARDTGAEVVLLSPAAASFDQFSGFEQRGARFAQLVRAMQPLAAGVC